MDELITNNACGTLWESIIEWGMKNNSDNKQQIACEMMSSVLFVCHFLLMHMTMMQTLNIWWQKKWKTTSRKKEENQPMRLFIPGPAGSRKSE